MAFILVYITNPNLREAKRIASHLMKKRLIACANLFPIKSVYWWGGKQKRASEVVAIAKTRGENWKAIRDEVEKIHPYAVPCIMKIKAASNLAFESWIKKESKGGK